MAGTQWTGRLLTCVLEMTSVKLVQQHSIVVPYAEVTTSRANEVVVELCEALSCD